jgi:hypothetical protein
LLIGIISTSNTISFNCNNNLEAEHPSQLLQWQLFNNYLFVELDCSFSLVAFADSSAAAFLSQMACTKQFAILTP